MSCFETLLNILPVAAVYILITYSYYVFVVIICVYVITDLTKQISYLTVYHITFLMMMWCYFATTCATHERVPSFYKIDVSRLSISDVEKLNRTVEKFCRKRRLLVYTRNENDTFRFCRKCKHVKPDRAHHCSSCERCILKMDHHCPWMNNCVGYTNHKQYILLLIYSVIYCLFCCGTSLEQIVDFFVRNSMEPMYGYQILAMAIISFATGVMMTALCCYHFGILLANKTTLEDMKEPVFIDPTFTFDLGTRDNLTAVFGDNCCLWFFPIKTATTNGYEFPVEITDSF